LLYNNDTDGSQPTLLYHKIGTTVEKSTVFTGFYNMNLSESEPDITLMTSGGKRRSVCRKQTNKRRSVRRKRTNKRRK
jgi:hypothetical protein